MATGILSTQLLEETKQQSLELLAHDDGFVYETEEVASPREELPWLRRPEPMAQVSTPRG